MRSKLFYMFAGLALIACTEVNITNLDEDDFVESEALGFSDIVAIGKTKCAGCHVEGESQGSFNFDPDDGVEPEGDQEVLDALKASVIDLDTPTSSIFLKKPLEESDSDTHTAVFANTDDADYQSILSWIEDGAPLTAGSGGESTAKFSADVKPIFTESCATTGCHTGASPAGGLDLSADSDTLYADVSAQVTAGDGAGSDLVKKASNQTTHSPGAILATDSAELEKIIAWIDAGALDD